MVLHQKGVWGCVLLLLLSAAPMWAQARLPESLRKHVESKSRPTRRRHRARLARRSARAGRAPRASHQENTERGRGARGERRRRRGAVRRCRSSVARRRGDAVHGDDERRDWRRPGAGRIRSTMGRIEDANHHVEQLNRMYMSTIETLAMAVDAKDQVTHGHIRRVQEHSEDLARHMGGDDDNLIKVIEAASLLHDMGKLALPEDILNKPGKPAEFEVMKTYSSVGADILAAIDFPYPVVLIVRCHHENWDGSGYPDGLIGTEIPIGARILAVVDCFDALTSDRPRSRLPVEEAIAILTARRGSMYDPFVVDVFIDRQSKWSRPKVVNIVVESSPLTISLPLPVRRA